MLVNRLIYFVSMAAIALTLARSGRSRMFRRYALFYFQLACAFFAGVFGFFIVFRREDRVAYSAFYWNAQFATMILACGNIVEILRHAFGYSRETRRFARSINIALSAAAGAFLLAFLSGPKNWRATAYFVSIERDFRAAQALILLSLLAAVVYFGVTLGRNLTGIFLGYGLYVGSALVTLAIESHFPRSFSGSWVVLEPLAYAISLFVYLFSLWTYDPPPRPQHISELVRRTDELLSSMPERIRLLEQ